MITLVKQEFYKLFHKKSTYISTLILLIFMTTIGIISKVKSDIVSPKDAFSGMYDGTFLIVLFMIAACSSIIAMEFEYGTIKQLLYRTYSRSQVLFSKWLTMFLYSIYFNLIAFVFALILKVILYNNKFRIGDTYSKGQTIMQTLGISMIGDFLTLWLVLSLVFLLTNIFKTSAAAITIGIIGYFATSVINYPLLLLIKHWNWLKWNPINMMNLSSQMLDNSLHKMTLLSTPEMVYGNLAYIIIFMGISYFVFNRRNV